MHEYPKLLFKGAEDITVRSADEEAARLADGYTPTPGDAPKAEPDLTASAADEEPEPDREGPTFGAADVPHVDRPSRARAAKKK